jgi:hypothetical protein
VKKLGGVVLILFGIVGIAVALKIIRRNAS